MIVSQRRPSSDSSQMDTLPVTSSSSPSVAPLNAKVTFNPVVTQRHFYSPYEIVPSNPPPQRVTVRMVPDLLLSSPALPVSKPLLLPYSSSYPPCQLNGVSSSSSSPSKIHPLPASGEFCDGINCCTDQRCAPPHLLSHQQRTNLIKDPPPPPPQTQHKEKRWGLIHRFRNYVKTRRTSKKKGLEQSTEPSSCTDCDVNCKSPTTQQFLRNQTRKEPKKHTKSWHCGDTLDQSNMTSSSQDHIIRTKTTDGDCRQCRTIGHDNFDSSNSKKSDHVNQMYRILRVEERPLSESCAGGEGASRELVEKTWLGMMSEDCARVGDYKEGKNCMSHEEGGDRNKNVYSSPSSVLSQIPPSPRLKRLMFKSNIVNSRGLGGDDATDEISADVERILEEIAGLDQMMDKARQNVEERQVVKRSEMTVQLEFDKPVETDLEMKEIEEKLESIRDLEQVFKSPEQPEPSETVVLSNISSTKDSSVFAESPSTLIKKPPLPPSSYQDRLKFLTRASGEGPAYSPTRSPLKGNHKLANELGAKLSKFREELHRSREEISKVYPQFEEMESSVRSSMAIDRFGRNPQNTLNRTEESSGRLTSPSERSPLSRYVESGLVKEWNELIFEAKEKLNASFKNSSKDECNSSRPSLISGILETDLDSGTSRELAVNHSYSPDASYYSTSNGSLKCSTVVKSPDAPSRRLRRSVCSMQNLLTESSSQMSSLAPTDPTSKEDRSRSMEFLLDDEKNSHLLPPENALKKSQETRQVSEHELRIQRSLQRLNVPDWYKNYATPGSSPSKPPPGKEFGSGTGLAGGWSGLSSSKTSSLTSLQSAGRYAGSRTQFSSRLKSTGTASTGGRSSRESLMSPSSTASASPSPYYERSSFTYGMPYALTRFATTRMSCGASPASLSPSPSPVGGITSSTSTPVSSGPMSRYGYNKTPYLGWRSQERLNSKTLYRSPSERMAADLLAQKQKSSTTTPTSESEKQASSTDISIVASPRKENASDLSLNTSDDSNSNKLNRVRSSIKEVSNAIVDYVNETKPLDDGMNGRASPRRGLIWLESSFVGTKPIDSPGTPDKPSVIMTSSRNRGSQSSSHHHQAKRSSSNFDEQNGDNSTISSRSNKAGDSSQSQPVSSYLSRNEVQGDRSTSSSVSSPTLEDILDSLLALRRPHKKIRSRPKGHHQPEDDDERSPEKPPPQPPPPPSFAPSSGGQREYETPVSDWQERMNQPLDDSAYFPADTDSFMLTSATPPTTNNEEGIQHDLISERPFVDATPVVVDKNKPRCDKVKVEGATTSSVRFRLDDNNDDEDDDDEPKEELEFGTPSAIAAPTLITNPLAGLTESPTPARHRRVSFDLDVSDKDDKSSSRSKRDECIGGSIQCKNSKCGKTATGLEARREFKTCHNCNAYYCSRDCRRIHWEKHKKVCMQSRVGQLCKQIISHVKDDSFVVSQLSTVAKRGFLAKGRGSVKLFFSSPDRAERFLTGGLPELPEPWYIPQSDMLPEEMGPTTFSELSDNCRSYHPDTRFVLYVSVCVVNEVPTSGAVKWEREMISRSSKIRLLIPRSFDENQPHHHAANPAHLNPDDPAMVFPSTTNPSALLEDSATGDNDTLILRSVPTPASQKLNISDDRRRREVSFTNIQKHLIERGVDLRRTYPDIYSKLCNYVENDEPFLPVTIYPKNSQTGRQFMCVIMPESSDTNYGVSSDNPTQRIQTINISEQS